MAALDLEIAEGDHVGKIVPDQAGDLDGQGERERQEQEDAIALHEWSWSGNGLAQAELPEESAVDGSSKGQVDQDSEPEVGPDEGKDRDTEQQLQPRDAEHA